MPRMTIEMPSNKIRAMRLDIVDGHRHGIAHRDLVADDPLLEAAEARGSAAECDSAVKAGRPSKVSTPSSQAFIDAGIGFQPLGRCGIRLLMPIQDGRHHFALAPQRELQIVEQPADVRALGRVAFAASPCRSWRRQSWARTPRLPRTDTSNQTACSSDAAPRPETRPAAGSRTARSTCASIPCSLDSINLNAPRLNKFSCSIFSTSRLPSLPGSIP